MDNNTQPVINTNMPASPNSEADTISKLLKNKKVLLIGGGVLILLVFTLPFLISNKDNSTQVPSPTTTLPSSQVPTQTQSIEMKKAVKESEQEVEAYNSGQTQLLEQYSWIRKLPVTTAKYYVYFDVNQKKFIGKLYPDKGEDIEKIKADALKYMAERGVITTGYEIIWQVYP